MRPNLRRTPFLAAALLCAAASESLAQATQATDEQNRPVRETVIPETEPVAPHSGRPAESLRPSQLTAALALGLRDPGHATGDAGPWNDDVVSPIAQSRNTEGLAFMIAGGAAFVAGLIIGDDVGTIIAVGGVGLGVYGIIIYF